VYDGRVRSAYLALLLLACSPGGGTPPQKGGEDSTGGTTTSSGERPAALDPRCVKVRPRVEALYQQARDPSADKDKDKALADDLLAANVTMVMNDCRAEPERVASCAERATDAAELERTCLIPLDDEGAVDGDKLKGK
jgi:hypothetical protein